MAGLDPLGESFFSLHDSQGEFRVILGTWMEGTPQVTLLDKSSEGRASLRLGQGNDPALELRDKEGHTRLAAKVGLQGDPSLLLMDERQTVRAHLGFSEEEDVLLNFYDETGEPRAGLGVLEQGEPTLQMGDARGNLRLTLGATRLKTEAPGQKLFTPVSSILLLDEAGGLLWSAPGGE